MTTLVNTFNFCVAIIMEEDFVVLEALLAHDGSTNLAEADAVAPPFSMQAETCGSLFDVKGGAVEVTLAEGSTDFQFLADGERLLGTNNLQFPDTTALATLQGNEVGNSSEVVLELFIDETG